MKMKLLDLQTGKYLELGKDWGYFGEFILIVEKINRFTKKRGFEGIFLKPNGGCDIKGNIYNIKYDIDKHIILNKIAGKVGAVVYGGRYVLLNEEVNGDVFCEKTNFGTVYYISKNQYRFLPVKDFNENNDIDATVDRFFMLNKAPQYKIGNIFEEFSKKEQGLENKFDELYDLIYGKK